MPNNLAEALGQPCVQNWRGIQTDLNVQQQLAAATNLPIGEGFLQRGAQARFSFPILCLKGVYVIESSKANLVIRAVERWMRQPVPWARVLSSGNGTWCGPSYVCDQGQLPGAQCGGDPYVQPYPSNVTTEQSVCLPQYNYTQRVNGKASSFCWNASNVAWAAFWSDVGDAIKRYNANESPLR